MLLPAPHIDAHNAASTVGIALSSSSSDTAIAINGQWKSHTGDTPQWSASDFDDPAWQDYTIDLQHPAIAAAQSIDTRTLPGWQSYGHPLYTGFGWYRIRLGELSSASTLSLAMPKYVDDMYKVYLNVQKIGSFRRFGYHPVLYFARSQVSRVPSEVLNGSQPASIAIRFWSTWYEGSPDKQTLRGGLRAPS